MTEVLSAPLIVEFPFTRSTGPVIGAFLTGLRERAVLGVRGSDGRVLCPPAEYDPVTAAELRDLVPLPDTGVVTAWAWNPEPRPQQPLTTPFAWVLVRLDGADTALLHVLDAPPPDSGHPQATRTGLRVRVRWAERRVGAITDIACFVPEEASAPAPAAAPDPAAVAPDPVTRVTLPARLEYRYTPGTAQSRFLTGLAERRLLAERCPECTRVYIPPRGVCPTCGRATTDQLELPHTGTVTTFCIVNIAAKGLDVEVPYCYAYVLLDGAHVGLHARIGGLPHEWVHVGLRVRAVWRDTGGRPAAGLAAISHFEPTGDPDAAPASYRSWM